MSGDPPVPCSGQIDPTDGDCVRVNPRERKPLCHAKPRRSSAADAPDSFNPRERKPYWDTCAPRDGGPGAAEVARWSGPPTTLVGQELSRPQDRPPRRVGASRRRRQRPARRRWLSEAALGAGGGGAGGPPALQTSRVQWAGRRPARSGVAGARRAQAPFSARSSRTRATTNRPIIPPLRTPTWA